MFSCEERGSFPNRQKRRSRVAQAEGSVQAKSKGGKESGVGRKTGNSEKVKES